MMRSAAWAIACKPLEQKRLSVTEGTSTGKPARRVMARATFKPCSPSGMAHPTNTSSMSRGSSLPSVLCIKSRRTVAIISSARRWRVVPFLAFPTAVRVAATITASRMMNDPFALSSVEACYFATYRRCAPTSWEFAPIQPVPAIPSPR
jgi:hypothetical protein